MPAHATTCADAMLSKRGDDTARWYQLTVCNTSCRWLCHFHQLLQNTCGKYQLPAPSRIPASQNLLPAIWLSHARTNLLVGCCHAEPPQNNCITYRELLLLYLCHGPTDILRRDGPVCTCLVQCHNKMRHILAVTWDQEYTFSVSTDCELQCRL